MGLPAFDTHKAVKALCRAGFDDNQAEAVVDQINGAVNENVATKADLGKLATREDLAAAVEKLATKEELAKFATREDLAAAVEKLATKEDLAAAVEKLATKEELAKLATKVDQCATKEELAAAVEKLELRMAVESERVTALIERQATRYIRYTAVMGAGIVAAIKGLDYLLML